MYDRPSTPYLIFITYEPKLIDIDHLNDWLSHQARAFADQKLEIQVLQIPDQPAAAGALDAGREPNHRRLRDMTQKRHDYERNQRAYAVHVAAGWWRSLADQVKLNRSPAQVIAVTDEPIDGWYSAIVRRVQPQKDRAMLTDAVCREFVSILEDELKRRIPLGIMPLPSKQLAAPPATEPANTPPAPPTIVSTPTPGRWNLRELEPGDAEALILRDAAGGWAGAGVTRIGKAHMHHGKPREDAFRIEHVGKWWLAAVADGGGSYRHAAEGSRLAAAAAIEHMTAFCRGVQSLEQEKDEIGDMLRRTLRVARHALEDAADAKKDGSTLADFSTTLLLVAYHTDGFLGGAQIGDGLIAAQLADGNYVPLVAAESGEYASETNFLTRGDPSTFKKRTFGARPQSALRSIILMTDGVADDFIPAERHLTQIMDPVFLHLQEPDETARTELIKLLGYEIRGSFDDRTLVVIYNQRLADTKDLLAARIQARRNAAAPAAQPAAPATQPVPPGPARDLDDALGQAVTRRLTHREAQEGAPRDERGAL